MNHYPHHLGDYAKDTVGLSQGEHGAYLLLIFAAYSTEAGIDPDEIYAITKAASPAERKGTDRVLKKYWIKGDDGLYHQRRIDEEIIEYRAKAEHNRRVGKTGGRPKRNPDGNPRETQTVSRSEPKREPKANPEETLASSHKPVNPKTQTPNHRGNGENPPPQPAAMGAVDESKAHELGSICAMNRVAGGWFNSETVRQWVREGVTGEILQEAIAEARRTGKPDPEPIPIRYLLPIVARVQASDPKAVIAAAIASIAARESNAAH